MIIRDRTGSMGSLWQRRAVEKSSQPLTIYPQSLEWDKENLEDGLVKVLFIPFEAQGIYGEWLAAFFLDKKFDC